MDVVKYYISFSKKSPKERNKILNDYEAYLLISLSSSAGLIYKESREALKRGNLKELKRLGAVSREKLANDDFEPAPQPFDPKFIQNQQSVVEYRSLIAETQSDIPADFREHLL